MFTLRLVLMNTLCLFFFVNDERVGDIAINIESLVFGARKNQIFIGELPVVESDYGWWKKSACTRVGVVVETVPAPISSSIFFAVCSRRKKVI